MDSKNEGSLWARFSVRHTKKTCAISCLFPLSALGIIIALGLFSLSDPTNKDYLVKSVKITQLEDSREAARALYPFETSSSDSSTRRTQNDEERLVTLLLRNTREKDKKKRAEDVNFEIKGRNLLTRESLARLKYVEDQIVNEKSYDKYCWFNEKEAFDCEGKRLDCTFPNSITNHPLLYGQYDGGRLCGRKADSKPVTEENFSSFIQDLTSNNPPNPLYSAFLGKDFDAVKKSTSIIRSFFYFGETLKNDTDTESIEKDALEYRSWITSLSGTISDLTDSNHHTFLVGVELLNAAFENIILRDLSFAGISIMLVFIIIWIHTTSLFLASTALSQIILAFPLTYLVYRGILQVKYFAALQIMTIFLILGIGAHDVFVFTDAWKQEPIGKEKEYADMTLELIARMTGTYRRAVRAMTVTSFTTSLAFFVTAASPIMPISSLGVWAGLLILLQFVLVITIYPCATIIWHRFWRGFRLNDFYLRLRGMPPRAPGKQESDGKRNWFQRMFSSKKRDENSYRPVEKIFNGPWTRILNVTRIPLIILGAILIATSIFLATRLETPREEEKVLPDSYPSQKALNLVQSGFPVIDSSRQTVVRILWGITGIDRKGTSRYRPLDIGKPVMDTNFSLTDAAAQNRLLEACQYFADPERELLSTEETLKVKQSCWISDFQQWRASTKDLPTFETYASEESLVDALIEFGNWTSPDGSQPNLRYLRNQEIAFNENRTRVVFTEISFVSNSERVNPYSISKPVYDKWVSTLDSFNSEITTEEMKNPIIVGGIGWAWMVSQKALIDNMFLGIGIVLPVSLFSLTFATGNWIVSVLALISIGGILANLLGLIRLLGWSLGITESIGVVIAVGFSFDYVAHLATAYVESEKEGKSRLERTQEALTHLGISILFGALSTILAGSCLFFAIIIFFVKFGSFVVMTVVLSLIWGLVFFPSLLMTFGPINDTGEVKAIYNSMKSRFTKDAKQEMAEEA